MPAVHKPARGAAAAGASPAAAAGRAAAAPADLDPADGAADPATEPSGGPEPGAPGKKFERFQVEMERLGRKYEVEVDVRDVRVGRGRHEIVSRGVFKDAHNWISVQTRGAATYQATIGLTLDCIDRRGFVPRAYRLWTGAKWTPWTDVAGYPKPKARAAGGARAMKE